MRAKLFKFSPQLGDTHDDAHYSYEESQQRIALFLTATDGVGFAVARDLHTHIWFGQAMVRVGRPIRKITKFAPSLPNTYAFLSDLAEIFVRLLDVSGLVRPNEVVQFQEPREATSTTMLNTIPRVVGRDVREAAFPWWIMFLLSPRKCPTLPQTQKLKVRSSAKLYRR
ncbi:MAG: hypothetical protein WBA02_10695 [Jannaschia helgolandensis]|uniref:hypothetical protein n=1 Tax=Jannaschia helgolandensis TaxID=188906 RepID=UPI000B84DC43|nr:hypothetical protein [Jannaschia helgolandensis]